MSDAQVRVYIDLDDDMDAISQRIVVLDTNGRNWCQLQLLDHLVIDAHKDGLLAMISELTTLYATCFGEPED